MGQVQSGDTNRQLSLWRVEVEGEDEPRTVVQSGARKYTTVINVAAVTCNPFRRFCWRGADRNARKRRNPERSGLDG